ncbi:MAG: response regulator [SAR324 cluster bacterium]|nr:response regulator [SAR324 cluster bacterium]
MKIAHKLYILIAGGSLAFIINQFAFSYWIKTSYEIPRTIQSLQNDLLILTSRSNLFERDYGRSEIQTKRSKVLLSHLKSAKPDISRPFLPQILAIESNLKQEVQIRNLYSKVHADFQNAHRQFLQSNEKIYQASRKCLGTNISELLALNKQIEIAVIQEIILDKNFHKFTAQASLWINNIEHWIERNNVYCSSDLQHRIHTEAKIIRGILAQIGIHGNLQEGYRLSMEVLEMQMIKNMNTLYSNLNEYVLFQNQKKQRINLIISMGIVAVLVLLSLLFVRSITRPLRKLLAYTQSLGKGDYLAHVPIERGMEFEVLISTLKEMSSDLMKANEQVQKQMEFQLQESETRWQFALEGNQDGVWDWNVISNEVYFSPMWKRQLGFEKDEISNHLSEWDTRVHPEDKEAAYREIDRHLAGKSETYKNEHRVRCKNGEYIWILDRGKVIEWTADGKPLRFIGTHSDITELKRSEQILKEGHDRFAAVMDSLENFVYVADMDNFKILFVNKSMKNIYGDIEEKICWQTIYPGQVGPCSFCTNSRLLNPDKTPNSGVHWEMKNSVSGKWLTIYNRAIHWVDGRIVRMEIATDITEYKLLEEKLEIAKMRAENASSAKSRFLANMSHEIRTPMNAILGFSQILVEQAKHLSIPIEFQNHLGIILQAGTNLLEIINNVLDLSKIEAGKFEVELETINLKLLVQGIFHINKASAVKKGLIFNFHYSPQLSDHVVSDRTKLNQILVNLVGNAIKFTSEGMHVDIKVEKEENWFVFQVEDQGIGIAVENQEKIFEAFEQEEPFKAQRQAGTGLGLAITKSLVRLLGGTISVESIPGQGSIFRVKLPLHEADAYDAPSSNFESKEFCFSKESKILVAEDNFANQSMIKALFRELGLEIELAENGKEAIEKAVRNIPDLILMDINMPEMDGLEATQLIRSIKECQEIPIIAISADAFKEQQNAGLRAGITEYLTKPIQFEKLLPVLGKYLKHETKNISKETELKAPLPNQEWDKVLSELHVLSQIPHYLFYGVDQQIDKILNLCEGYQSPFPDLLKKIRENSYSRNSEKNKELIEHFLISENKSIEKAKSC